MDMRSEAPYDGNTGTPNRDKHSHDRVSSLTLDRLIHHRKPAKNITPCFAPYLYQPHELFRARTPLHVSSPSIAV
jgi:hypothetical protein